LVGFSSAKRPATPAALNAYAPVNFPFTTAKDLPMRFLLTNPLLFLEGVRKLAKSFAP
jgi:hypothetical protein